MFQPTAAILCHSLVDLDGDVLSILKAEESLLIHQVSVKADRQRISRVDTAGRELLAVYINEELIWDVRASLLSQSGLGDYHPGRALSATGLEWANGEAIPFQFKEDTTPLFIYESPSLELSAGDLPSISFRIRAQFFEFDRAGVPDTGDPDVVDFADIPAQTAVELSEAWRQALLFDVFNNAPAFGSAPFTAALWQGDPEAGGTPLFAPIELAPWSSFSQPTAETTSAANTGDIVWTAIADFDRIITHVRFQRGPWHTDLELAAPLEVPANAKVRAEAGVLGLKLTWPWDIPASAPSPRPSRQYLEYSVGGTREAAEITPTLNVMFWNEALDTQYGPTFGVNASAEKWEIAVGLTVNPLDITGIGSAGPGGWPIRVMEAKSGDTLVFRERHNLDVAEGFAAHVDRAPSLSLDTPGV